jgi:hypothetical protein
MYQTAIQEWVAEQGMYLTDDQIVALDEKIGAIPDPEMSDTITNLNTRIGELERLNTALRAERDNASRTVTTVRDQVQEFLREQVEDNDFDRDDANTFLRAIGSEELAREWNVEMKWSYHTIATATVIATDADRAVELAQEQWEVDGVALTVNFRLRDTDGVDWDQTTADYEDDSWDIDVSDYIEFEAEEA